MIRVLGSQYAGPWLKIRQGINQTFNPSEVDKMSTRNSCGLGTLSNLQ